MGCEANPELDLPRPEPQWHGEHLSIGVEGVDVCEGSFAAMDRNVGLLSTMLGAPSDTHLTAYILSPNLLSANGLCRAQGCAWRSEIWSLYVPASHELTHAVRTQAVGWGELIDTPPVLEEGLAELLGDALRHPREPSTIEDIIDVEPAEGDAPFGSAGYERAGHFVRFLVERHSLEDVLALMRRAAKDPLPQAFDEALGESLDEVLADYADYPWCSRNNWRIPLLECSGEPLPWDAVLPRSLEIVFDLACDADAIGPRWGRIYRTETVDIDTPGAFIFEADTLFTDYDAYSIRLVRCDASCEAPFELEIINGVFGPPMPVDLAAGRYYVEFARDSDANDLEPIEVRLDEWDG